MNKYSAPRRVVSGMRTTGRMHLGNYHGALKSWLKLQNEYDCYFFAADWHALTTTYDATDSIASNTWLMIQDWLSAGLNPKQCKIFVQSGVKQHAELHLLLSMITPVSWLERVPTYKDTQQKLANKDLQTYGFLGYPVLQAADILLYKPELIPVGEDQISHVELTREIARRFNHIFGKQSNFSSLVDIAIKKMGKKQAKLFKEAMKSYTEQGSLEFLEKGQALLASQGNLSKSDIEVLHGYLEGTGQTILKEPDVLLSSSSKMSGLDGQKMSKSYNNTIHIGEEAKSIETKIKKMPTDPARVRRADPGDPNNCPVWKFHEIYSSDDVKQWVVNGCTTASIGCIECKGHIIDSIDNEVRPIRERAKEYAESQDILQSIVQEGIEAASMVASDTIDEVKQAIGLAY